MDNYIYFLKKQIDDLYNRINKERDSIIVYNMIEKENSTYKYIFKLPDIINKNLQCGNYKRALRYYVIADTLMKDVEDNKKNIVKKITDYVVID